MKYSLFSLAIHTGRYNNLTSIIIVACMQLLFHLYYSKVFRGLVALSSKYVSNLDLSKPVATEPERIRQRGRFVPSSLSINVATEPERIRQRKVQYSYRSAARIIAREDKLAQSISYWTTNTDTTRLNEYQERALYKAIENNFQLIQGPPGNRSWMHAPVFPLAMYKL